MNDYVFEVHCSNGFCKFDSYTTTKIKIMYETLEHYKVYKQKKDLQELQKSKEIKLNEWKKEMDKFITKLITKNGTTNY